MDYYKYYRLIKIMNLLVREAAMMSIIRRFLVDTADLRVLHKERAGRILGCVEEIGVSRGRSVS
jgi:hypothetical protein